MARRKSLNFSDIENVNINQIFDSTKINELFKAKAVYGQLFLFRSSKYLCISRPLTISECEGIVSLSSRLHEVVVEDWIFSTTFILGNQELDYFLNKAPFGYIKNIAGKILVLSNAQDEKAYKKALFQQRGKMTTLQNVMEIMVSKAYKSYSHHEIKNMTQIKQIELLAKSEAILGEVLELGDKRNTRKALRTFVPGAEVLGGEIDITSPEAADKPDFNESF